MGLLDYFMPALDSGDLPGPSPQSDSSALGLDFKFAGVDYEVTADGDYLLVERTAALRQAVYHCLVTTPGDYKLRPNYGVGLENYVGKPLTSSIVSEIQELIRRNLLQMKRIQEVVQVDAKSGDDNMSLFILLTVRSFSRTVRFAPFTFSSR